MASERPGGLGVVGEQYVAPLIENAEADQGYAQQLTDLARNYELRMPEEVRQTLLEIAHAIDTRNVAMLTGCQDYREGLREIAEKLAELGGIIQTMNSNAPEDLGSADRLEEMVYLPEGADNGPGEDGELPIPMQIPDEAAQVIWEVIEGLREGNEALPDHIATLQSAHQDAMAGMPVNQLKVSVPVRQRLMRFAKPALAAAALILTTAGALTVYEAVRNDVSVSQAVKAVLTGSPTVNVALADAPAADQVPTEATPQ